MTASSLLVEPAYSSAPAWHQTLGPEVADLARLAGFAPDPEQEIALDALFAFDRNGSSVAFETAVICCRQNMKTGLFKQAALGWLFLTEQRLVVWSAHEFRTAQEAFRDMDELVSGCDLLRKRVKNVYRGNGDESIELLSGARLIFKTRTKGGGRGLSGDKVVLDEAFALQPMHMGALLPTLSARPDPQVVYGSSAGLATSETLRGVRDRGRAQKDPRLAYFEWCAPESCVLTPCDHALDTPGCALDDEANWRQANPAMGRRISVDYIAAERRALPPAEFARERLGWWDKPGSESPAISPALWASLEDVAAEAVSVSAFAVATDPDRTWSAIGIAGPFCDCVVPLERCSGDRVHVESVAHDRGTGWVVARCVALNASHGPAKFVVDGGAGNPAATLIPEMEAAGLDVVVANARDVARSYGLFMDGLAERTVIHGPQPELAEAVKAARTRPCGDGGSAFGRKASGSDITPLEVVSLAHWAAVTAPKVNVLSSIW